MTKKIIKTPLASGVGDTAIQTDVTNTISSGDPLTPNISESDKESPLNCAASAIPEPPKTESLKNNSAEAMIYGNLSPIIVKQCEKAKKEIMSASKFSDTLDSLMLFKIAQRLIAFKAWLINHKLSSESQYREKRAGYIREGSSAAAAEQEAKISQEYRAYKYLEEVYNLAEDQIMLLKRFKEDLGSEFRNSRFT